MYVNSRATQGLEAPPRTSASHLAPDPVSRRSAAQSWPELSMATRTGQRVLEVACGNGYAPVRGTPVMMMMIDDACIIIKRAIGCVHNQQSDRSRFVRRDRSSPMKKNVFVRFITVTHTITSLYPIIPQSVPMIGHLELAVGTLTSHASWARGLQQSVREVRFSQIRPSGSGFDYERGAFRSDRSDF